MTFLYNFSVWDVVPIETTNKCHTNIGDIPIRPSKALCDFYSVNIIHFTFGSFSHLTSVQSIIYLAFLPSTTLGRCFFITSLEGQTGKLPRITNKYLLHVFAISDTVVIEMLTLNVKPRLKRPNLTRISKSQNSSLGLQSTLCTNSFTRGFLPICIETWKWNTWNQPETSLVPL